MKFFCHIIFTLSIFAWASAYSQKPNESFSNYINQYDNKGRKHGYWEVYVDQEFRAAEKGNHRYVCYTFFYHGDYIIGVHDDVIKKLRDKSTYTPDLSNDTLLNGHVRFVSKSGDSSSDYVFEKGMLKSLIHTWYRDSIGMPNLKIQVQKSKLNEFPVFEFWQDQDSKGGWVIHYMFDLNIGAEPVQDLRSNNPPCNIHFTLTQSSPINRQISMLTREHGVLLVLENTKEVCLHVEETTTSFVIFGRKKRFPFRRGKIHEHIIELESIEQPQYFNIEIAGDQVKIIRINK